MIQADGILDRVADLAAGLKLANLRPQIAACRNQLQARDGIDVAVFGRFKAGKSSFLNHLAGRAVLPIGVVPLTAVITRLRYGETERAEVHFLEGSAKTIPLDQIGLYVGENENPNNRKQVASVEIELPELKLFAPLQFVDTPGLGSAFTHNTEVAMDWLPNAGAALVAVSSDAPLSERDLALLAELRRHTPRIVLLLTKADLLTAAQRVEVLDFVRHQLRGEPDGELPAFFYSIRPELPDLKAKLQDGLLDPLRRNRAEAVEQIFRHKLRSLVNQTLDYLRIALAAATQTVSAREALQVRLTEERQQFTLLRSELNLLARDQSAHALERTLEQLRPTRARLQERITTELREQMPGWKVRLPALLVAWREWLGGFLSRELAEVSRSQRAMFCEPLHQARAHLTRTLRAFQDRLAAHVQSAMGVSLAPPEFVLEVREPSAPPVQVAYAFDASFAAIAWLIPLTLFRRPVERALRRKARYEVEKNLSRLAAAWRERVAAGIAELNRQAEQQARDALNALEQMLAQTASREPEFKAAIDELERFRDRP